MGADLGHHQVSQRLTDDKAYRKADTKWSQPTERQRGYPCKNHSSNSATHIGRGLTLMRSQAEPAGVPWLAGRHPLCSSWDSATQPLRVSQPLSV